MKKHKLLGLMSLLFISITCFSACQMFTTIEEQIEISSLSLERSTLKTTVGEMTYLSISIKPSNVQKDVQLTWNYDSSIIQCDTSSVWGVTIKAISAGQTTLTCSYRGYDASCLITVEPGPVEDVPTEPYIYSNYSIIQTSPGVSEKVFVSLYGGSVADIDSYSWTVDNNSVVDIQPTGQYCIISAKSAGYARVKITHSKASYPYYIGVYVFEDATKVSYITTENNILTMNQNDGEQTLTVSLVNGLETSSDSQFRWEIIKEDGSETPIGIYFNGNKAVVTPLRSGVCTVRVTHPDAVYPLDILCRVISIVKNVYIQPDKTVVTLDGDSSVTITSDLANLHAGEFNVDDFSYRLENYEVAEIVSSIGNQVTLKGLANGSCKLLITHPNAAYAREVLIIATNQLKDAVDASCYITTSQNYIRTKVGNGPTTINISLKGGEEGDEKDFVWSVDNPNIISLETPHGSVIQAARSASFSYAYGNAYITPKNEGTAVITITHPKILYPTEILVKVLDKNAILEEPLYFSGAGLIKILNGNSTTYKVELNGSNKDPNDEAGIKWACDSANIGISANGNTAEINAPTFGSGCTKSFLSITHNKVDCEKKVLIMTADDQEALDAMKALYSDKLYYNIKKGTSTTCFVCAAGYDEDYDFSGLRWTVKDSSIINIEQSASNPFACKIEGLKSGSTILTATFEDVSCDFTITVYPESAVNLSPEVYFTTSQNVIVIDSAGKSKGVYITAINLNSSEFPNIKWESENTAIATVVGNGTTGTITAVSEGETVINVSHPLSQNTLKLYVRIGSEFVIPETEPLLYISSEDNISLLSDDEPYKLQAILVNGNETNSSGFRFETDNNNIAMISAQSQNGVAYIKPVGSGQCQITISHSATNLTKKVLVVVGNSSEELSGFTYLTTVSNVVAIGEGSTKTISVSVKNTDATIIDGYTWVSSNPSIVDVTSSGATAVLTGNGIGTAFITVTNNKCKYSLSIIAQCVDPIAAAANPYIQLSSSVINLMVGTNYNTITADLVGGTTEDFSRFEWKVNDSNICAVYGQNEVGKLKALAAGQTYVTVSHPRAAYPAQVLVICDEEKKSDCYISVPSSIISMKPNAGAQTVTATLINGSATDKYNFSWSMDVYDVIDFQYSANVCTITPLQTGTATITITHPKAAYSQQIIVSVQEYSSFAFPQDSFTATQGNVSFLNMQVPTTSLTTHVEYSVDNPSICSITGTKAVAQITGVSAGSTTVRAKLVASGTGTVQASAEMLVYIKEAPVSSIYITASNTIFTVNKGKSQTLTATLTGAGVTNDDQYQLKWRSSDTDIISVTGISSDGSVTGKSIYITANKPGEALITCSHAKAASDLQFYVVVPGTGKKAIFLNKTYITVVKGSSGSQLKATIENAESMSDYSNIEWSVAPSNGHEIARVMGSGQQVTIYPLEVGETTIYAQLPDIDTPAKCTLLIEAGKSFNFETTSKKVQPFHYKNIKYTVSPPDAKLTWVTSQDDDYFEFKDLGHDNEGKGIVQITGLKDGEGTLNCVTDGSAKGMVNIKVGWDYSFKVDTNTISGDPTQSFNIEYTVNPPDADISISQPGIASVTIDRGMGDTEGDGNIQYTGKGTIKVQATGEGTGTLKIEATNKETGDTVGQANVSLSFLYKTIHITASQVQTTGRFSSFDSQNNILYIGDGETVTLGFNVAENIKWSISSSSLDKRSSSSNNSKSSNGNSSQIVIKNSTDYKTQEYVIPTWYVPMEIQLVTVTTTTEHQGGGSTSTSTQYVETNNQLDPKTDFYWCTNDVGFMDFDAGWTLNRPYWKKEIPSKAGSRMSVEEYKATPWYWQPAHGAIYHWSGRVAAGPWAEEQTGNQPATLVDTSSTAVISSVNTDTLTVNFSHGGQQQKFQIQVVTQTRACPAN